MIRRLLANLPTTAQALCPSPFLDANLFLYDDKLISPVLRMRAYVEQPLKFSSRAHPAACRFKVGVTPCKHRSQPRWKAERSGWLCGLCTGAASWGELGCAAWQASEAACGLPLPPSAAPCALRAAHRTAASPADNILPAVSPVAYVQSHAHEVPLQQCCNGRCHPKDWGCCQHALTTESSPSVRCIPGATMHSMQEDNGRNVRDKRSVLSGPNGSRPAYSQCRYVPQGPSI